MYQIVKPEDLDRFLKAEREETVYAFRPSFAGSLFGSFTGLMTIAIILAATFLLPQVPFVPDKIRPLQPLFVLPLWMVLPAWWVKYYFTNYTLTTQRLIMRTGLLLRETDEVELYRVKDLKCMRSLLNRVAGIGTIRAVTSELDNNNAMLTLYINNIAHSEEIRDLLRNLTQNIRIKRGVREADMNIHQ